MPYSQPAPSSWSGKRVAPNRCCRSSRTASATWISKGSIASLMPLSSCVTAGHVHTDRAQLVEGGGGHLEPVELARVDEVRRDLLRRRDLEAGGVPARRPTGE